MKSFQPDESLVKKRGNLPHWTQDGVMYFVTFRLADSIPEKAMNEWSDERVDWIRCHGFDPKDFCSSLLSEEDQKDYARRFGRKFHELLDAGFGDCVLRGQGIREVVVEALRYFDGERYDLDCFVVMPNHVHLLFELKEGFYLSDILRSVKSFSGRVINRDLGREGKFWQTESYDRIVRNERELERYRNYILENPAKAKLREGEYAYFQR